MTVLDRRGLNRATLDRQLLLRRSDLSTMDAIERLVGLQAQNVNAPYLGLRTRLENFSLDDLADRQRDRQVVRGSTLRGTQHLVRAADYPWLRVLIAPALARSRQAAWGRVTAGLDLAELTKVGRDLLVDGPLTRPALRDRLARRWPEHEAEALAWSVQALVPVLHPPPSGLWRRGGATPFVLAEDWLGVPIDVEPDPGTLVRRYLAAFGPASVADLQAWSGVTRLAEVVPALDLAVLSDEDGRTLYDLPGMTYPDPDTPAPVRLLPEFDNLMVAYTDRTRVLTDEYRKRVCVGAMVAATVLVDGTVRGTWKLRWDRVRGTETATLSIDLFERLSRADRDAVAAEAHRLLDFAAATSDARTVALPD
jgi:hypothetical protein